MPLLHGYQRSNQPAVSKGGDFRQEILLLSSEPILASTKCETVAGFMLTDAKKKKFTWTQHGRNKSLLANRANLQKNPQECCPLHSHQLPSIKTARFFSFPQISLPLSSPILHLSSIKFYLPVLLPLYAREPSTTLFGLGLFVLSTPMPFTARRHRSLRRPSRQQ